MAILVQAYISWNSIQLVSVPEIIIHWHCIWCENERDKWFVCIAYQSPKCSLLHRLITNKSDLNNEQSDQVRSTMDEENGQNLFLNALTGVLSWRTPHQIKNFMGLLQNGLESPGFQQKQGFLNRIILYRVYWPKNSKWNTEI